MLKFIKAALSLAAAAIAVKTNAALAKCGNKFIEDVQPEIHSLQWERCSAKPGPATAGNMTKSQIASVPGHTYFFSKKSNG